MDKKQGQASSCKVLLAQSAEASLMYLRDIANPHHLETVVLKAKQYQERFEK